MRLLVWGKQVQKVSVIGFKEVETRKQKIIILLVLEKSETKIKSRIDNNHHRS